MDIEKRLREESGRLRKMGWNFLGLATLFSTIAYFSPDDETSYWLSVDGKEGFYVLSAFLVFLGFYCFGAIWRRQNFI